MAALFPDYLLETFPSIGECFSVRNPVNCVVSVSRLNSNTGKLCGQWNGKLRAAAQHALHCGAWSGLGRKEGGWYVYCISGIFACITSFQLCARMCITLSIFSVWRRTERTSNNIRDDKKGKCSLQTYMFGYS